MIIFAEKGFYEIKRGEGEGREGEEKELEDNVSFTLKVKDSQVREGPNATRYFRNLLFLFVKKLISTYFYLIDEHKNEAWPKPGYQKHSQNFWVQNVQKQGYEFPERLIYLGIREIKNLNIPLTIK